jgi:hypothetical protein
MATHATWWMVCALALGAGCAAWAGEAHSPAEWLGLLRRGAADQKARETEEWRDLLLGAAMSVHPKHGGIEWLRAQAESRRPEFRTFTRWWGETGAALYERWLRDGRLSEEEHRYRFVLSARCSREWRRVRRKIRDGVPLQDREQQIADRMTAVVESGMAVLRKGYRGFALTAEDLEALRLYAIWIDVRLTGQGVLPFHLDLTRDERWRCGETAPDFVLPRMEVGLNQENYGDRNPCDPTDVLRPAVLREYLLLMQGYEARPDGDGVRARPRPWANTQSPDYVRLSSFRGRKPVLLILANPTDLWAWHFKLAPMLEPLYRACDGRVEFFLINTTIHDTYMPVMDFLDPEPGRHHAVHDLSLAQRARTCKLFYMDRPHFSMPYLLDDMAQRTRNAYMDQGGGAYFVLVDLDGCIAYFDYHQDIPPHWGPDAVSFRDEYIYVRMNHLESRLAALLANGGRYAPAVESAYPTWRRSPVVEDARVLRIDGDVVELSTGDGLLPVQVRPGTRVIVDGQPTGMDALVPRVEATVCYEPTEAGSPPTARFVLSGPGAEEWYSAWHRGAGTLWAPAVVEELRDEENLLVAHLRPAPPEHMRGLRMWRATAEGIEPFSEEARERLALVKNWIGPGASSRRRFLVDLATDVWLNGHACELADLRPGDRLGVQYRCADDGAEVVPAFRVRAYRLPPKALAGESGAMREVTADSKRSRG